MKINTLFSLMVIMILSTACPSSIDPVNPYDPDTPTSDKAKATLTGSVLIEGNGDVTQVEILVAGLTGHPEQDGTFVVEGIPPTIQEVLFRLDGYEDVRQSRLFSPGSTEEMNVRIQVMRGSVVGSVLLQEQNDHSGVTVVLVPANDTAGSFQLAALTATRGNFVFDSVPVGTYRLSASKPHYMGKVVNDVKVDPYGISQVPQLELPPVTGAVEILGGDPDQQDPFVNPDYPACCPNNRYSRTRQVLLHTEGFNAVRMKASEDQPSLQGSEGWETYQTEQMFELSELNGSKTIYVLLEDANGVRSDVLEGHTVLDTQPPSVMDLVLGDGSGYTSESTISVSAFADDLPAESGTAEMRMQAATAPSPDAVWQPYQLRAPFILPEQDGEHLVFVELRDRAGNRAQVVSGSIRLDRQQPHPLQGLQPVVVHNGSGYALGMDVPIYFNVTDEVTPPEDMKMVVCETEGCAGVPFSPFAHQTIMSFSSEGTHTVYAMFKDGAGNVFSPEGVTFEIDTRAPTFPVVSVEEGLSVSSADIHLLIDVSGADQILVSDSAELPADDDPGWTTFETRLAYNIGQTEGEHLIFVYARDFAGHMTGPAMASVELDTTPPDGTIHIRANQDHCNGTQCYTNSESVLVQVDITSVDETSTIQMRLSLDDVFDEPLQAYSPMATVLLAGDQSIFQNVYAQLEDQAGNTSQIMSDNGIRLDLAPPNLPMISTIPSGYTSTPAGIVLHLDTESQDDVSGVDHYEYLVDPLVSTWAIFDQDGDHDETLDLTGCQDESCEYTFKVRAVDLAGNIGDPSVVQLILDTHTPNQPTVSVSPSSIDKGPEIVNADAVSVWVQADDSNDDNFDQFQARIRTCSGGFDSATADCAAGWNSWSAWRDTGVGQGGREIFVVLAEQDSANEIQIRARDLAGRTSTPDSVIFTEDSHPPTQPVLYPASAQVNADTAILYISDEALDENAIDSYECSVNGKLECLYWDGSAWSNNGDSSKLPADTTEVKVNLAQDSTNTIRIRAMDKAGNYSQNFVSSITEKTTVYDAPRELTARNANRQVSEYYTFRVTNLESMDMDDSIMATTFSGKQEDNSDISGLLIHDFNSNLNTVFVADITDVHIEHQQIVATVPLLEVCEGAIGPVDYMYDPTQNPELTDLCACVTSPHNCDPFSANRLGELLADYMYNISIPVIIDMTTGEPIIRIIYTDQDTSLGTRIPMVLNVYGSLYKKRYTSFDGMNFAWIESPSMLADDDHRCTINVITLDNDYGSGGEYLCEPDAMQCIFNFTARKQINNVNECGRLAISDKVAGWTEVGTNDSTHIRLYDYHTDSLWELGQDGAKFDRDMKGPMIADCRWDSTTPQRPLCRHIFWVDSSTLTPILKVVDLENPASLLTDTIRRAIVELPGASAEDGKIAWLDMKEGTMDVFYMDLDDPSQCDPSPGARNCIGNEKPVVKSNDEEDMLAMSRQMVPYWRLSGDSLQLHMSHTGSLPWILARPGMHVGGMIDGDMIAVSAILPSDQNNPYKVGIFDNSTQTLSWKEEGTSLKLPVSIKDLGTHATMAYLATDENTGAFDFRFCDSGTDCMTNQISLLKTSSDLGIPGNFTFGLMRGDENRALWVEYSDTGHTVILDCDMDPAGFAPCSDQSFRLLFHINSSQSEQVCAMGLDDDVGIIELVDNNDIDSGATAYRLDMVELDSRNSPIEVGNIHGLDSNVQGIQSIVFGGSVPADRPRITKCSDYIEHRVAVDAYSNKANVAFAMSHNGCLKCKYDNPYTYFKEDCDVPPCCGDEGCNCDFPQIPFNLCHSSNNQNMNLIGILDDNDNYYDSVSQFTHEPSIDIQLLNGFLVWKSMEDGRWVFFLRDTYSGSVWKMFLDNKNMQFPLLHETATGTFLMWTDASLGPMEIFNTQLFH